MFAHDILRASLSTPSFSPASASASADKRHYHHHNQHPQHIAQQSSRPSFSPSSTASTVPRAGDAFGRGSNLLGSFDSTTGEYSPPAPQGQSRDSWGLSSSCLRDDDAHAASWADDAHAGVAGGGRDEALVAKVQQLQEDNAAMSETIRALQSQLMKRPKSPPKNADKSALLPRMIKDR
jgi:hypothetical protein